MRQALLIFVKNAVKGQVKTRLAATVGDDVAFSVYQQLLRHTENCTRNLLVHKIVCYSSSIEPEDIWSNDSYGKYTQQGLDLGERMNNAFQFAFGNGYNRVAIIGSDCFEITEEIIEEAFIKLDHNDVVIGPAVDGGYYLLAMKAPCENIFHNIEWSTDQVLSQTLAICDELGLKVAQPEMLSDIDTEEDLIKMGHERKL